MSHPTINARKIIGQFHQFMQPKSQYRILFITGEGKMGKSHLLTKVFRELCHQHQADSAVIDFRNNSQTIIDLLENARFQLEKHQIAFPKYLTVYDKWTDSSNVYVKDIKAVASQIKIDVTSAEPNKSIWEMIPRLTTEFVNDLSQVKQKKLLFLFDSVDNANSNTSTWLMNNLLEKLYLLNHVRVIAAGRQLPETLSSYDRYSHTYKLEKVKEEEEEYISYCEKFGLKEKETIRVLAQASNYTPGMFLDLLCSYLRNTGREKQWVAISTSWQQATSNG